MFNGKINFVEALWDKESNGGSIVDLDPSTLKESTQKYYWRCYSCGHAYKATVYSVLRRLETSRICELNLYCEHCRGKSFRYSDENLTSFINNKDLLLIKEDIVTIPSTPVYVFHCPDCGKLHYTTLNTLVRRGTVRCKSCASEYSAIKRFGSLASCCPDILPYYTKENVKQAEKRAVWKTTEVGNNVYLICPVCGKHHYKRMDAVINNGARCEQCVKNGNKANIGQSLKSLYPEVASMYDKSEKNLTPSSLVMPSSNKKAYFYCDGIRRRLKPHIFYKKISMEVLAYYKGIYGNGCPICQGTLKVSGINDFKTMNPEIADQWDYDKNSCNPEDVYFESETKYYFKCKKGHEFKADPKHLMRSRGTSSLGCPICHGKEVVTGQNDIATLYPELMEEWLWNTNSEYPYYLDPYKTPEFSSKVGLFKCKNCGSLYETTVSNWIHGWVVSCENCRKRNWSYAERELADIIKSWGFEVKTQYPVQQGKYFLDIYLPERNIAIEYNGLYWHSDAVRRDKNYHYNKYIACKKKGISLYCVWEDDYSSKRDIVLKMLKRKLGISNEIKINARDCNVYSEDYSDVKDFMNKNHLQGAATGSYYITLRDKYSEELRGVAVLKWVNREDMEELTLVRYCTNSIVRGGFSKIITTVLSVFNPAYISTFSDNAVSDGSLYSNNGFVKEKELAPDYSYVVGNKRKHKFEYRLSRFRKDPGLIYEEGKSESELAKINNIPRCWDYGKIKWILYNTI